MRRLNLSISLLLFAGLLLTPAAHALVLHSCPGSGTLGVALSDPCIGSVSLVGRTAQGGWAKEEGPSPATVCTPADRPLSVLSRVDLPPDGPSAFILGLLYTQSTSCIL